MIEVGQKWGLTINFTKSAIIDFFSNKTNYNHLSDQKTIWEKGKGTELQLNITVNGEQTTIKVPLVTDYKYLGIRITRDFQPSAHLQGLRKKINHLSNAFKSIGGASQSLKFCANTWQVFIRPLLDYSQTYFSFLEDRHREKLNSLYRQSARKMMFIKGYTPNKLIDTLIQYNYQEIHHEYRRVAQNKTLGRKSSTLGNPRLSDRVNYNYKRVDLTDVPLRWVKVCNMLHYPHKEAKSIAPILKTLEEIEEPNIGEFMDGFIVNNINQVSQTHINKLNKIYKVILSIL